MSLIYCHYMYYVKVASPQRYELMCWAQTLLTTAHAMTYNKLNKQSLRRPASFLLPSRSLSVKVPRWKMCMEGREGSKISCLSFSLSYGTRCRNRTVEGAGNLQFSVLGSLLAVNNLAMSWWMLVYQSNRLSITKESDPASSLSRPLFHLPFSP